MKDRGPSEALLLQPERELLVRYCQRLGPDRLAVGTSGNLSVRVGDLVAITPRGVSYDRLTPERICLTGLDGDPVEEGLAASSELPMHLTVYRETAARAVVHTHSPYATALSTLIEELPPIHYLIALLGGSVRVAPYATPGTARLAEQMAAGLKERFGVLLANHGALTIGETLERAYDRAVILEWLATLYYRARMAGEPKLLCLAEIDRVAGMLSHYEQSVPEER